MKTDTTEWRNATRAFVYDHLLNKSRSSRVISTGKLKSQRASFRTIEARFDCLVHAVGILRSKGFAVSSPEQFKAKHIHALVQYWENDNLSPVTLQNYLSFLRVAMRAIGKGHLVPKSAQLVSDPTKVVVSKTAIEDKSWSAKNIKLEDILPMIAAEDQFVANIVELAGAFGLRLAEATQQKLTESSTQGGQLYVIDGTKGRRPRVVPIETDKQRDVIERLKQQVKRKDGTLGNPRRNLQQNRDRVYRVLRKLGINKEGLGVTAHGLRHQYANDTFELLTGDKSPVRGGLLIPTKSQLEARRELSERLGHSRPSITTAYTGSVQHLARVRHGRVIEIIENLASMDEFILKAFGEMDLEYVELVGRCASGEASLTDPIELAFHPIPKIEQINDFVQEARNHHPAGVLVHFSQVLAMSQPGYKSVRIYQHEDVLS
ncbi:MAG: hypothetical protein CMN89_06445 [Sutterellaceae bacterium]|uniref:site-specific integrase n=1 Tax=uncultured Limnobacter sp. TaxID=199681 RepID=UPI000C520680|nr:hypothetical protein [Sutterellaceae bacterium]MBT84111.1 hypothetical protein [Sutterellaceae bacterium]